VVAVWARLPKILLPMLRQLLFAVVFSHPTWDPFSAVCWVDDLLLRMMHHLLLEWQKCWLEQELQQRFWWWRLLLLLLPLVGLVIVD